MLWPTPARSARGRLGRLELGRGAVQRSLADEFLLKQLLLALVVGARIGQRGGRLRFLGLAARNGGGQFLCGEPYDDRPRLDVVADIEIDRCHAPGHLGVEGGLLDGFDCGFGRVAAVGLLVFHRGNLERQGGPCGLGSKDGAGQQESDRIQHGYGTSEKTFIRIN